MLLPFDTMKLVDTFFSISYSLIKFCKKILTIFRCISHQQLKPPLYKRLSESTRHIYQCLNNNHKVLNLNLKEIKELPHNLIQFIEVIHSENSLSFLDNAKEIHMKIKKEFLCPISRQLMNIPVSLGDYHYDLESLLNLPKLPTGEREIPLTKKTFYLNEIKPNWDLKIKIQWEIKDAENHYLNKITINAERLTTRLHS